jgi:hypothetical protein
MNETGLILVVLAGVLVGITGGLLFLGSKNKRLEELKKDLKDLSGETEALRGKLSAETERRAVAEEKSSRIPELDENLN